MGENFIAVSVTVAKRYLTSQYSYSHLHGTPSGAWVFHLIS